MFTRRTNSRERRQTGSLDAIGGSPGLIVPTGTPRTIVTSVPVVAYWRLDPGFFTVATGVDFVTDQTGNGHHLRQSSGSLQFTYNATGGPNNTPIMSSDGVDDVLTCDYIAPLPGTTQTFYWLVARRDVAGATGVLIGSGSTAANRVDINHLITDLRATSDLAVGVNVALAAGTWARIEAAFANSVAIDYLKVGATSTGVGTAIGNRAGTVGVSLGANSNSTIPSANSYLEAMITIGVPTELAALDAYVTARYGAGLV